MMVGISMTTAEPTLVLKKVMVASQPLPEETQVMRPPAPKNESSNETVSDELPVRAQYPYHTPQPGMPTVWIMLITTWAMKTKKKAMKLKELSVLQGEETGCQDGRDGAGGLV